MNKKLSSIREIGSKEYSNMSELYSSDTFKKGKTIGKTKNNISKEFFADN